MSETKLRKALYNLGIWRHRPALSVRLIIALFAMALPTQAQDILSERVRLVGRFHSEPSKITAEWPGSLIEIRFEGTQLDVTISDSGNNSIIVEVDGKPRLLDTQLGEHTYSIVNGENPSNHVVRIIKRTEAAFGKISLTRIWTDGSFMSPIRNRKKILVLGDSISTGYGVEGADTNCGFEAEFENQYLTYAAVAARNLDADIVTLAVSGAGLVRNYNGETQRTMTQLLYQLLPSSSVPAPLPLAEVVVVHLGTNDFADGARPNDFIAAYETLLKEVQATSPDAMIYATMGPMLRPEDQNAAVVAIESAVVKRHLEGDDNVAMIRFGWQPDPEDLGCDWHPSAKAHARMAIELEQRIRKDINWEN